MTESTLDRGARLLRQRVAATAESLGERFPHYADPPTGEWTTTGADDWPGAFWVAMCWLSARQSVDQRYGTWARRWAERLDLSASPVSCGLRPYYGAVVAAVLCHDAQSRSSALAAARTLSETFDPTLGICSDGSGETAISTVTGVALLAWAARQSDRDDWRAIAVRHAGRHIEFCIRPTGSVWSSVVFDPASGAVKRRYARKGLYDGSAWARGQAWGILGYTLMHLWTDEREFLDVAQRAADWWMVNSSHDHVAFWDFDDPASFNATRDTSASAIVAAALLKLAVLADDGKRAAYRREAEAIVTALVERFLDQRGVLSHGCDDKPRKVATKHELIWGSYYLLEAIEVLAGRLPATAI